MKCYHVWNRTNGVVDNDGGDSFRCNKCGKTGHSYGLGGIENVIEDSSNHTTRNTHRDYAKEYTRRKIMRDFEKNLGKPLGIRWSTEQYNLRMADSQQQNAVDNDMKDSRKEN